MTKRLAELLISAANGYYEQAGKTFPIVFVASRNLKEVVERQHVREALKTAGLDAQFRFVHPVYIREGQAMVQARNAFDWRQWPEPSVKVLTALAHSQASDE